MITAELEHNPYLLETNIRFNKQAPHINSLVEKYQGDRLQSWIKRIPSIFHDEMNGYDFTLEFSGTATDYDELKKAFAEAGVSQNQVNIVLKKEIDDRKIKLDKLSDLLTWLKENRNHYFDYEQFRSDNEEIFNGAYPFIVIQGRGMDVSAYDNSDIAVENIDQIEELNNTDLTSTPVLFYLDAESLPALQKNLKYIRNRKDVIPEQLFFNIHPQLSIKKVARLIRDLGIQKPQIVKTVNDPVITRFIELYPCTDYVYASIRQLKERELSIAAQLEDKNRESEITNSKTHETIRAYDESIARIKSAIQEFSHKDEQPIPDDWLMSRQKLLSKISDWRKKKVKMTKSEEANAESIDFDEEFAKQYDIFYGILKDKVNLTREDLTEELLKAFQISGIELEEYPNLIVLKEPVRIPVPQIRTDLLRLNERRYVDPKEDIVGMLFKQGNEPKQKVLEITYTYQKWREYAVSVAGKTADQQIRKFMNAINQDYLTACCKYLETLQKELIKATEARKDEAMKLSDDEKKLQTDNDWMSSFTEQLHEIERG